MKNLDKVYIIDDLAPKNILEDLRALTNGFHWHPIKGGSYDHYGKFTLPKGYTEVPEFQFISSLMYNGVKTQNYIYDTYPWYYLLNTISQNIFNNTPYEVNRIKANFNFRIGNTPKSIFPPHTDSPDHECYTLVYYLDDSDGDTIIFNEKYSPTKKDIKLTIKHKVQPKLNRGVLFPSLYYHAGCPPINYDSRRLLNINFNLKQK